MIKRLYSILLVFVLVSGASAFGQVDSKVLHLRHGIEEDFIGGYLYYFIDEDHSLSITDAVASDPEWISLESERPNFGNSSLSIWNKITIVNETDEQWFLDFDIYTIDTLRMYRETLNGFDSICAGRSVPFADREYKTNSYLFDLDIPKGDTVTYYFNVASYILQYPLRVHTRQSFIFNAHKRDLMSGIYLGFVALIFLYNFFIWLSVRDKNYLFYIGYIFFKSFIVVEISGLVSEFVFVGKLHQFWDKGSTVIAFSSLFLIAFTVQFLETKKRMRRIDILFKYVFVPMLFLNMAFDIMGYDLLASMVTQYVGVLILISMYIAAIISYRSGLKSARFYMMATLFYFAGVVVFVLKTSALVPYSFLTDNAMSIGASLEMLFFSLALADKINDYKRDREKAIRRNHKLVEEQNIVLEKTVAERTKELKEERDKSEELLLNILPEEIADEIKATGHVEAKEFDPVTVMFCDFKNFTEIAEGVSATKLLESINLYFKRFDDIVTEYGVEKIKTIGDAYMAAFGLAQDDIDIKNIIFAALDMRDFVLEMEKTLAKHHLPAFEMRIGLHTGSVVAGVVGEKKFQYDLWGDAVNTAARMETNGEVGKVNISESVYEMIKNAPELVCTHRGEVDVKGKGALNMYFVERSE